MARVPKVGYVMLQVRVKPETTEQLRALAGSSRKVGAYLDTIVPELFQLRSKLEETERTARSKILAEALVQATEDEQDNPSEAGQSHWRAAETDHRISDLEKNVDLAAYKVLLELNPALIANIRDLLQKGESPQVSEGATSPAGGDDNPVTEIVRGATEHMRREGM